MQHCRSKNRAECKPVESKEFLTDFTSSLHSIMDGGWQILVRRGKDVKQTEGGPQGEMYAINKKPNACVPLVERHNCSVSRGER